MDTHGIDDELREVYERNSPSFDEDAFSARLKGKTSKSRRPASARRPSGGWRVAAITCAALVLVAGLGTGIFETATHLGKHGVTIVIEDDTASSFSPSTTVASGSHVDLGRANGIKLTQAWSQIAARLGFDTGAARALIVELDYSASGSLVHLFLDSTIPGREIRATWDGYGGQADQAVLPTVTSISSTGGPKSVSDYPMYSVLAAIEVVEAYLDSAGTKSLFAKLPALGEGGNYRVGLMHLDAYKGSLPPDGKAYAWDGSAFQPLTGSARSGKLDSNHLALSVVAREPLSQTTTTLGTSTSSTYGVSTATTSPYTSSGGVLFVIPVPASAPAGLSSTITTAPGQKQSDASNSLFGLGSVRLDVTPRAGVHLQATLAQQPGSGIVVLMLTVKNDSQSPFSFAAKDFTLYVDGSPLGVRTQPDQPTAEQVGPGETGGVTGGYFWHVLSPISRSTGLQYVSSDPGSAGFNRSVRTQ